MALGYTTRDTNRWMVYSAQNFLSLNGTFSVCCWYFFNADVDDFQSILEIMDMATAQDGLALHYADGASLCISTEVSEALRNPALTPKNWYHVGMVREGPSALRLYLAGALVGSITDNHGTSRPAASFYVGRAMSGWISDVKAWPVALSAAEMKREMDSIRPVSRLGHLGGWWPMRANDRGLALRDYSGRGRHLTMTGGGLEVKPRRELPGPETHASRLARARRVSLDYRFASPSADVSNSGWTRVP
jgi:hypothetical protein